RDAFEARSDALAQDWRAGDIGVAVPQEQTAAKVHGVLTELAGDATQMRFVGPHDLRHTEAAIGARRWFVRVDTVGVDARARDPVRAEGRHPRLARDARTDVGIGTGIPEDLRLHPHELRVSAPGRANPRDDTVLGGGDELLLAGEDDADGSAGQPGEER